MSKDIEAQRRRHIREKSVIDHLAKELYKPKPALKISQRKIQLLLQACP
jgi:hypothetical protein